MSGHGQAYHTEIVQDTTNLTGIFFKKTFSIIILGSTMCLWLICILFPITRTFFFGAQVVILLEIFPGSVFGKVYGISVMSAGAGSFIANKVFLLAPNFVYVHCILAVLIILSFSFPFYLYKYHPRKSV